MHTLLVLTAVLSSLPVVETSVSIRDSAAPGVLFSSGGELSHFLLSPARHRKLHLLASRTDAPEDADSLSSRVATEALVGAAMGIGGMVLGGALVGFKFESPDSLISPMVFLVMGSAMGVTLSGALMDGRGNFGFALLGSVVGFAVPLLVGSAILASSGCSVSSGSGCGAATPIGISMLLLPTVGALIAYEASSPESVKPSRNKRSPASPSARVFPTLAPARQGFGVTLGMAGTL